MWQLCIVHMVRNSLNFVSWKTRKEVAADLRLIYQSATVDDAEQRLTEFEGKWDSQHPPIAKIWRRKDCRSSELSVWVSGLDSNC